MKLVYQFTGGDQIVTLYKNKSGNLFRVEYGTERHCGLTYSQAAEELGQCIMHSLACASALDPEE